MFKLPLFRSKKISTTAALTLGTAAIFAFAGCAPTEKPSVTPGAASQKVGESSLTFKDGWIKATDGEMTGLFGVFENSSDQDITISSATSPVAGSVEMHEVVPDENGTMVMQEKDGGFIVSAGKTHSLVPGADHIMLMDLNEALIPGATAELALTLSNGSVVTLTLPIKDYAGANEEYAPEGNTGNTDSDGTDNNTHGTGH
ncbi:copper chaperone PCu(A)C [Lysinibacter sp. HNR]|uniref:copper chaperone PCu(A)C n=1 Tax=Lysinibacter sp. HNR TaxID=3031408 RepID=UPI0024350E27|nr:copper chaperone PCu(A)C [Lysinibacter sp. HNR]WGD37926.1 copper chaperone PCu(A)C [Lysinibacter sp. HNR]